MNFSDFSLDKTILDVIGEIGYQTPTPVQGEAIPKILEGLDVVASAQTGTGKTGAFLLPALSRLAQSGRHSSKGPRMLILAPTRELAMQIASESERYSKYLPNIRTVCVFGGVPYPAQRRALSKPYDILVATPGRLLDHMQQKAIDLSQLKILVLDEADRMLDMGFIEAVEYIAAAAPKHRQTLLFSATLEPKILKISHKLQNRPHEIRVKKTEAAQAQIEQRLYYTDNMGHKIRLLDYILANDKEVKQAIIFTSTKRAARQIAHDLQDKGHSAEALHGDMNQRQRTRTVDRLRRGKTLLLVATDVAARGIDISNLSHVFNIDLPFTSEDYVHRIGRTGRAGAKGCAITFATSADQGKIAKIGRLMGKPLETHTIAGHEPQQKKGKSEAPREEFSGKRPFKPPFKKRTFRKGGSHRKHSSSRADSRS